MRVLNEMMKRMYPESLKKIVGAVKNPQTTIALTFLTYIISAIGGVPI